MFSIPSTLLTLAVTAVNVLVLVQPAVAAYTELAACYTPDNFFDNFDFFTGKDPTQGFVDYVDRDKAEFLGLVRNEGYSVYMGVDYWSYNPTNGRQSVRIESKEKFTRGLFVLDLQHLPGSVCGTWPAFWTLGDNWPNKGEIDIIEGVHKNVQNHMALHTKPGCRISSPDFSGTMVTPDCDVNAPDQGKNQGCSIADNRNSSYGDGFNMNQYAYGAGGGGGVYAMEWTSWAIKIWFWPRLDVPEDILNGNPEPADWGIPAGMFGGDPYACNIDDHFEEHKIIFDITFCGDWAGNVWDVSGCGQQAKTCKEFVKKQPAAFTESYWRINSLKVWSS